MGRYEIGMKLDVKRKMFAAFLSLLLIIALCGCGSKSAGNTIGPWDTSDPQAQAVLEILSDGGFSAFAGFDVDESYRSAKMGIEYFKDGKLVKDQEQGTFALDGASQGVAGFSCKDGVATTGLSAGGNTGVVSDIHLKGYSGKKIDDVTSTSMSVSRDISEGEKIYLGIVNAGSDTLNTSVLDSSGDKEKLKGKNWLFYVEFFSDSLE